MNNPVDAFHAKSKGTAILLSVFAGPFSWLYTYEKDARKFWVSVALLHLFTSIPVILGVLAPSIITGILLLLGAIILTDYPFLPAILWILAIVDFTRRRNEWYAKYWEGLSTEPLHGKNKKTAVLLTIFAGFFARLYVFEKNIWKFWTSFLIFLILEGRLLFDSVILPRLTWGKGETSGSGPLFLTFGFIIISVLVFSILSLWTLADTLEKSEEWYEKYWD